MNTIYYANVSTGERASVKVGQGNVDWLLQAAQRNRKGVLPHNHTKRRPTVCEADKVMYGRGFVRWSRKKQVA
jgi:hypothetical protein